MWRGTLNYKFTPSFHGLSFPTISARGVRINQFNPEFPKPTLCVNPKAQQCFLRQQLVEADDVYGTIAQTLGNRKTQGFTANHLQYIYYLLTSVLSLPPSLSLSLSIQ